MGKLAQIFITEIFLIGSCDSHSFECIEKTTFTANDISDSDCRLQHVLNANYV